MVRAHPPTRARTSHLSISELMHTHETAAKLRLITNVTHDNIAQLHYYIFSCVIFTLALWAVDH